VSPADEEATPITPEAIAALVAFEPVLASPDFQAGEWRGGETDADGVMHMPWFELSPDADAFMTEVRRRGWIFPFDWQAWQSEAEELMKPGGLEKADVATLRQLLVLLVRGDRFNEGLLSWAFESGAMLRIVRRLQVLTT
jgi:hypothetical protein